MADVDPLTLFPTTAPPSSGGGAAAKDDDPLKLFPTTSPKKMLAPDVGSGSGAPSDGPPEADVPPWMMAAPPGSSLDERVRNALAPAPGTVYGDVLPLAMDEKTGAMRFAMPNMLRAPLLGFTGGVENALTVDPTTGAVRLSPEAQAAGSLAATPLRFSGANALQYVAPGTLDRRAPLSPEFQANPMTPNARVSAAVETAAPSGPATPTGVPVTPQAPQSAGAAPAQAVTGGGPAGAQATPSAVAGFTPAEEAAYRATAEGKKFLERQEPGVPDRNSYVPGVTPNAAEQEQTVTMARELKSLGIASTEASEEAKAAAFANNEARQHYFEGTAKSPVDIANAEAARSAQAEADLKATWANKTDADPTPVVDAANAIKASPDGRRPAVRKAIDSVTSELTNDTGNLLTDPEQLYGVRKHLDDLLSKEGQRETPLSARATASLQALKEQLDGVIETAAPGFKQYLKNFSDASRGIDEMQVLQGHEKGLYDSQGRMTYNKFQTMMRNIVDSRNSAGLNPYKSISDETMQKLWSLRDDLRRSSSALELARAPGSDTASNAVDLAKQYARMGGQAAVMGIAHAIAPIAGPVAVRGVQAAIAPIRAAGVARRQAARSRELLYPSNPLIPPNAPP
jgi:hypothetical protein